MAKNAAKSLAILALAVAASVLVNDLGIGRETIIMVFLLGVLFTAVLTSGRLWATVSAVVSVALFSYLYTEPRYTFRVDKSIDFVLLIFYLATAVVAGTLTSRLQEEKALAGSSERTARTLYKIASGFMTVSGSDELVRRAQSLVLEHTGLSCRVCLGAADKPEPFSYEIRGTSERLGYLVFPGDRPQGEQELIAQAVCTQLGMALERDRLVSERENIRLAMEKERQRAMLLRSVAHDLRSPLTALSGASSLLCDNYDQLTDETRRNLASDVSEEAVWLSDLVENILNMTRFSENQMLLHRQSEVIDDVIAEAVKHTERLLRGRKFTVTLPDRVVTADMDARLIEQVVINLLENAARHTPAGCAVSLNVTSDGKLITVAVSDEGSGVPPVIRGRLFEQFVTQDQRGSLVDGRHGIGLGLAICRTIVEAHGGQISYADNQPHGSVFTFTLPAEEEK